MATNHGINVTELETSLSTPNVAESGVPFVVGTAPVQAADDPATVGVPVLVSSWSEAKTKLGYSEDWEKYTICEAMFAQFQCYGMGPVIAVNLLDPSSMTTAVEDTEYPVTSHRASLPIDAVKSSVVVKHGSSTLTLDTDYSVFYDTTADALIVELLSDGSAYSATALTCSYDAVDPSKVTANAVAEAFDKVDLCLTSIGTVPDILEAPGYSQEPTVAAVMAAKASTINGMFRAVAVVDIDSSTATSYDLAVQAKDDNGLNDSFQIVCWPMAKLGDRTFHLSSQIVGRMCSTDSDNSGVPYESPDNKGLQIDSLVLADGSELITFTKDQADILVENGIVTAINFINGWVAWGSYTACYPGDADPKDLWIPVRRMFAYIGNTAVKTFWGKIGKPMNRRQVDAIVNTMDIWLSGLVASEYLLGARVELLDDENPLTDIIAGKIKLHVYITPPVPIQELDFVLEYDSDYVSEALSV